MKEYREITYRTLTGTKRFIELGDHAYGEWIIYENDQPKYHVNIFDKSAASLKIDELLHTKEQNIEAILDMISKANRVNLSLGKRPVIGIIKKSKLISLNLGPLPESWVQQITT